MKHFYLTTILLLATMLGATAQPLLCGHRGSIWGVQNTEEAFINGAKIGYDYLETDLRVTKDGYFVLSHDEETNSLGGNLTIANATLEQLKAEDLYQTRSGVYYTGKICTLDEYLDICAEYNVKPLIELKWATGINSNDCTNIPAFIAAVEAKGFRNNCIIFTSMKECLEYIRTNYPDITLQFLTGVYWANHFDWCVEWNIDVDIEAGYFDKSTVEKFHDVGLLVNMWTTNTNSGYLTYGNYGCDFITTDYLDPSDLPELDPDILFPPNTVDYPKIDAVVRGNYNPELVSDLPVPSSLGGLNIRRALLHEGKWYVLALKDDNSPLLTIMDAESGEEIRQMDVPSGASGTIALNDIAFTADGTLLGCNLATVPYDGGGDEWIVYKWDTDDSTPDVFVSIDTSDKLGNWTEAVAGNTFTVSGRLASLKIYTTSRSSSGTTYRVAGLEVTNGVVGTAVYAMDADAYTEALWGSDFSIMVTPFSRNNLLVNSPVMDPTEYTFDWDDTRIPMTVYAKFSSDVLNTAATGISFLRYGTKVYAVAADCSDNKTGVSARIYNVTSGIGSAEAVSPSFPESPSDKATTYIATGVEYDNGNLFFYLFAPNEGMMKYAVYNENVTPSENAEFALELLWQNSNVTGNAPEHIDGDNAQQGGLANGLFYVNDCSDKKIYLFDQSGCIGSIPGGAGFGTACDDAGNIIVRNDKGTGADHSFIIYPAGATVENPGEPITLDVTVPLDGQADFISASGDVLGASGGHIYMYPNGYSAINILTVVNGEVTKMEESKELSMKGTTAGYVIPINDNSENWIYQIRADGYYTYSGGESTDLVTGRSSTSAPTRNTTVGGAYFILSGHEIFIYNSGAHYKGGFTIRDISTNEVITSVDPIGNLGAETGGNNAVANWIFAEKIDDSSYYIYQYCPANGMACYLFYDKESTGLTPVSMESSDDATAKLYPNPVESEFTVVAPKPIETIEVYSLSGAKVRVDYYTIDDCTATVNVQSLPAGIYLVKTSSSQPSVKLIKK